MTKLGTLRTPASTPVDLGDHGNGRGPFNGALDEVRFESVARSANWLKLSFENQKPLQLLVGPLVQDGDEFSVSQSSLEMKETSFPVRKPEEPERSTSFAGWRQEEILAVDRHPYL